MAPRGTKTDTDGDDLRGNGGGARAKGQGAVDSPAIEGERPGSERAPAGRQGDVGTDLREARREIAEVHAVSTRTNNAVVTLAASLRDVLQRQARYERGLNLNSFVAYLLFTVLLGGGFFLLYRSRADRLVLERDQAVRQRESAHEEAAELRRKLALRDEVDRKALAFWQLLREGKRAEAVARYAEIAQEPLTAVEVQLFQQEVTRARAEIIDAGHAEGLEAFRGEQWKRASTALKRALSYEDEGPRAAQMRYYLGIALHRQGDFAEAARQLELAVAGGAERTVGPDIRFYLAGALEMLRQIDRAREEYEKFAAAHPAHPQALAARRKATQLAASAAKAP